MDESELVFRIAGHKACVRLREVPGERLEGAMQAFSGSRDSLSVAMKSPRVSRRMLRG